jgi:hypothetical protein
VGSGVAVDWGVGVEVGIGVAVTSGEMRTMVRIIPIAIFLFISSPVLLFDKYVILIDCVTVLLKSNTYNTQNN